MYGPLTAPAVGIVLKELVRRAIALIRSHRIGFEVFDKAGYDGSPDLFTSADLAAQGSYLRSLGECFPEYGVVAEEDGLRVPCRLDGVDAYFTVDPLDGTKAFARGQSFGVATQVALVIDGRVAAAYVGDVCTHEIYGYRPESPKVHRISEYDTATELNRVDRTRPLDRQVALLREAPEDHHPLIADLVRPAGRGGTTRGYEITSGSIGISMSRLWKGEVGMHVLTAGWQTPWDGTPIIGMAERLGLVWLRPSADGTHLVRWRPEPSAESVLWDFDVVVAPSGVAAELERWCASRERTA